MEPTTLKFSIEAVSGSSVQGDLRFEDGDKAPAAAPAAAPVPAAAPAPQFGGLTQAEREAAWNDFRGLDMAEAAGAWDTLTALASAAGPDHQERGLLIGQWEDGAAAAPSAAARAPRPRMAPPPTATVPGFDRDSLLHALREPLLQLLLFVLSLLLDLAALVLRWPYFDLPFVGRPLDAASAAAATLLARVVPGRFVAEGVDACARPAAARLVLYEAQGDPGCRRVREALDALDLEVLVYPCPSPSLRACYLDAGRALLGLPPDDAPPPQPARYAAAASAAAAAASLAAAAAVAAGAPPPLPVLVDGTTALAGGAAVEAYLWETYGAAATPPLAHRVGRRLDAHALLRRLPTLFRPLPAHGLVAAPSRAPAQPLVLWGYEASPSVLRVREALCALQLPCTYRPCAIGSPQRRAFAAKYGHLLSAARRAAPEVGGAPLIQVPALLDPNAPELGLVLESAAIVRYLYQTYGTGDKKKAA